MPFPRREFLLSSAAVLAALPTTGSWAAAPGQAAQEQPGKQGDSGQTEFQIACMTLPYSAFPLERALRGIREAGYRHVAWGTTHVEEGGRKVPVVAPDAPPEAARELADRCRALGLEPVLMFAGGYPEAKDGLLLHERRLRQAAAAGIPQLLTFGHTEGGKRAVWIERLSQLAPLADELGVTLVVKQHGGETGTGKACAEITRQVNHPRIKVNYDAGNVLDYLNVDPLPDVLQCVDEIRSFCIKDHRNFPRDEDCGPGFGEIDHYRLLHAVRATGRTIPLCCENIFAPLLPRPSTPEGIDKMARRAREFLETVIEGLQQPPQDK